MSREYTELEMRELADSDDFAAYLYDDPKRCSDPDFAEDDITPMVKDMLRQAADEKIRLDSILDAIEKEFKKQSTCRSCEWRGRSIRSEPACPCDEDENYSVYEIDIVDRLRQAADNLGRELEARKEGCE